MRSLWILPLVIAISLSLQASDDIAELAEAKCGTCHIVGSITKEKLANISAPPMWAVAKKVKTAYPNKQDGLAFIVDFSLNPSESKMLFPKETSDRFGVMPSQEGLVTEAELRAIAEYLVDK